MIKKQTLAALSLTIGVSFIFSEKVFSAIPPQNAVKPIPASQAQSLAEKLTGRTDISKLKPAQKALVLARQSRDERNYILAIKRYNFIIKHFPKTLEARTAHLDKASLYKKMGLEQPAVFNQKRAALISQGLKQAPTVKR